MKKWEYEMLDKKITELESALRGLKVERDRYREALGHALRGDMDPEDRIIIAQIVDDTALQEGKDE